MEIKVGDRIYVKYYVPKYKNLVMTVLVVEQETITAMYTFTDHKSTVEIQATLTHDQYAKLDAKFH